eukprot:1610977-Pyramimonas_sp.AAC.1
MYWRCGANLRPHLLRPHLGGLKKRQISPGMLAPRKGHEETSASGGPRLGTGTGKRRLRMQSWP